MSARRRARTVLARVALTAPGRRVMSVLLNDPRARGWLVWHLSDRVAALETSFSASLERAPARISGFEDVTWLYTANALNNGVSRLTFDEAGYLWRLVAGRRSPRVAEIGRFRGGTTFLLAAAGGNVLSVDNDEERQGVFLPELRAALERFGLTSRVELELGDSSTYPLAGRTFELVFLDGAYTYDGLRSDVEHWLPASVAGGDLVIHSFAADDPRAPIIGARFVGLRRLLDELDEDERLERQGDSPASVAHYRVAGAI